MFYLLLFSLDIWTTGELKSLDLLFKIRGEREPSSKITLIDIGDSSLEYLGKWPWSRAVHGKIIQYCEQLGADKIGFDVLFTEKDQDTQAQAELVNATRKAGNVYHILFFDLVEDSKFLSKKPKEIPFINKYAVDCKENLPEESLWHANNITGPFGFLGFFAKGVGYVNGEPDTDGVRRRFPLFIRYGDKLFFPFAIRMALDFIGADYKDIEIVPGKYMKIKTPGKEFKIPITKKGEAILNFPSDYTKFQNIQFSDLLISEYLKEKNLTPETLKNFVKSKYVKKIDKLDAIIIDSLIRDERKIVRGNKESLSIKFRKLPELTKEDFEKINNKILIIGASATAMTDLYPTPYSPTFPQMGIHATIVDNFFNQNFIHPINKYAAGFTIVLLGLAVIILSSQLRPVVGALATAGITLIYLITAYLLFIKFNYWLVIANPVANVFTIYLSIVVYRFATEEKEKKFIKSTFQRYVSSQVVDELIKNPEMLNMKGKKERLTVFFSDIRGFTSMSEKMEPEDVVKILNEYLTEMTEIIFKYQGTLDKFIGDAIMAIWGAPKHFPNHAELAVRAAAEMQEKVKELCCRWESEGRKKIGIGMGINTGFVVIGNMGSASYSDYTVIGDNVNLAARLEENAPAGKILISESTYKEVKDIVKVRLLKPLSVKGKEKPVKVYEVLNIC
ncbi:MAG: adenylate/guanylate cyclase domain-containing protein [Elusimicrobia bacterium]|nr:adenylate/guanylate cyclase domain-containing protein [Elusimicrobiota bacterium]